MTIFLVALSTKSSSSNMLFSTSKKQSNSSWVDLFSKLANNSKLTSNKHKKHFKNKQTMIILKGYGVLAAVLK